MRLPVYIVTLTKDNSVLEQHAFGDVSKAEERWAKLYNNYDCGKKESEYQVVVIRRDADF